MTVVDDGNFLKGNHAAVHHRVDSGHDGVDLFLTFYDLDYNGKIGGETQEFIRI